MRKSIRNYMYIHLFTYVNKLIPMNVLFRVVLIAYQWTENFVRTVNIPQNIPNIDLKVERASPCSLDHMWTCTQHSLHYCYNYYVIVAKFCCRIIFVEEK